MLSAPCAVVLKAVELEPRAALMNELHAASFSITHGSQFYANDLTLTLL